MEQHQDTQVFYCEGCGGIMEFDIPRQTFRCPNCGREEAVAPEDDLVEEHDYQEFLTRKSDEEWESATQVMRCESCGAEIVAQKAATTASCGFCGSAHVLPVLQEAGIRPEGIVPFQVDRHKAGELFRKWIKGKWFAPGSLKNLYQQDKLQSIYLPYWTYDADTTAHYTGQGGRVYYVTVGTGEHKRRERRVRWYPVSGTVSHFFDDVLISARAQQDALLSRNSAYATSGNCLPFDLAYLSGFQAEKYTLGVEEGFAQAQEKMRDELRDMARREILQRFDEAMVHTLSDRYFNVKFKHVLLPMWMSGYQYQGKQFRFLINGQTGKVSGQYPKSRWKIALAVILGLILAGLLIYWFSQN
ncbi:MAG TPA: hypothetical protein VN366_05260 [Feifaniaceae bacterium]|nr:hypothetical protein [Feifaniaceae bacterium]